MQEELRQRILADDAKRKKECGKVRRMYVGDKVYENVEKC